MPHRGYTTHSAPYSPYRSFAPGWGCPVEHPSVTHRRMAEHVRAGVHPAVATQRARMRIPAGYVPPAGRLSRGDLASRIDRLVHQFQAFYGGEARIEIAPGGSIAEAYRDATGAVVVRVDPNIPDHALPSVVAHEMAHVLRLNRGSMVTGPAAELEATHIAGDFLRRGGYALEDGLSFLRDNFGGSALHGSLDDQLRALTDGYYARGR